MRTGSRDRLGGKTYDLMVFIMFGLKIAMQRQYGGGLGYIGWEDHFLLMVAF